jgi:NADH-quinone oxidoreductase subunit M
MLKNVKKASEIFYLHPSGIFIYANCLCLFIPTSGKFLLEDLYKLNLSATEQLWIFLAFFLAYAIKIHLFLSILGGKCAKAPAVGTMLL